MLVHMCQYLTLDVLRQLADSVGIRDAKRKSKKQLCQALMVPSARGHAVAALPGALLFRHATDLAVQPLRGRLAPEFVTATKGLLRRKGSRAPQRRTRSHHA